MKAHAHTRRPARRTGVSLALAATTVAAMTVPAGAAGLPAAPTAGATALRVPTAPQPRDDSTSYRVRAGDTVSAIAARTGTTVGAIVAANDLGSEALIKVGQVLRLPSDDGPAAAPRTAETTTHTVVAGDTVSALAKRYGTTVAEIVAANTLDSRALIVIGQRLTIPGGADSDVRPASAERQRPAAGSGGTHVVRSGETVSGLAKQYGTTVSAIATANGLRDAGLIYVGQRLTIPGGSEAEAPRTTPVSDVRPAEAGSRSADRAHIVRSGETVSGIAKQYGTTVAAIVEHNTLGDAALIRIGQRLSIPGTGPGSGPLVGDTFLGRTYARDVVSAANTNKATLNSMDVPSRAQMQAMVRATAEEMGVDPALALAIAQQESGFDARAVSPANAVGVMQVIPSSGDWASDLVGRRLDLLDPQDNVTAGVVILRRLVRTAPDLDTAIAGYYQGLAGVLRNGMYSDTRNYVSGIKNLMARF